MASARHVAVVAILFALLPAGLETGRGVFALTRLAGWKSAAEVLRPLDGVTTDSAVAVLPEVSRTRWPILLLMCGLTLLLPGRWAVGAAWAYVIAASFTVAVRVFDAGMFDPADARRALEVPAGVVTYAQVRLHFLTTQAMDLLAPLLLLLAAKMRVPRPVPADDRPAEVAFESSPVLAYQRDPSVPNLQRWALRLAFAAAAIAAARTVADFTAALGFALTGSNWWIPRLLPMYFYGTENWNRADAISEYLLRAGSLMLMVGLWPTRATLVWSRFAIAAGLVCMAGWAVFETAAVAIADNPMFLVAGHDVYTLLECLRIVGSELAALAILAAMVWPGPVSPVARATRP